MQEIPSEQNRRCIAKLIELGMLKSVVIHKSEVDKGIIVALCADGHQFRNTLSHIEGKVETDCIHAVSLNGGALLMNSNLMPEEQRLDGDSMFRNILKASEIKGVKEIFLYTHFPCAIAVSTGLGVVDQGLCLMEAKRRIKQANPDFHVRCFFHVDEKGERRTYFLPKELWNNPESYRPVLHDFMGAH